MSILEVLYRNGTQVLGEHDRGGFTLNFARAFFTPGFDGIYQIVVGAGEQDRSALGSYTLSVRVDDFADDYETGSTTVMTPSTTAFATIDSDVHPADPRLNSWDWIGVRDEASPRRGIESLDDRDVFRIEIAEAGDYVINVSSQTTRAGIWFVWDYQGNLYNRVESRPVESIVIRFSPGTYYVEIGTPHESFRQHGPLHCVTASNRCGRARQSCPGTRSVGGDRRLIHGIAGRIGEQRLNTQRVWSAGYSGAVSPSPKQGFKPPQSHQAGEGRVRSGERLAGLTTHEGQATLCEGVSATLPGIR